MIYEVRHATRYDYSSPVELAAHVLHLRPRELSWQKVHRFALRTSVPGGRWTENVDHFGNKVSRLFLDQAHASFEVASESVIEVPKRPPTPHPEATPAWERVAVMAQRPEAARDAAEFAFPSAMAPAIGPVRDWAHSCFAPGRPLLACALDLMGRIAREFRFEPGVTTVSTSVARVLQLRAGVCQDFAHLMIAGLRAHNLPARYVSGYVRTHPPPGMTRLRGADQSHAWVGCWLGPEWGWIDLDPTNDVVVAQDHVWLGWGRDYADVSPVHGVLLGGGRHSISVSVDMEPLEQALPERICDRAESLGRT